GNDRNLRYADPVRSDAEGVSVLEALPMGELPLEVDVDGCVLTDTLSAGERTHTVEIPARCELRVQVIGEPATDAVGRDRLRLRPRAPLAGNARWLDAPPAPGRFVSTGVFPGTYEVELVREAAGAVIAWKSAPVRVTVAGGEPTELTLEL
ncbi:MAG: hypothetical protein AAFP86_20595, partial [Planctomycetota bacterium]